MVYYSYFVALDLPNVFLYKITYYSTGAVFFFCMIMLREEKLLIKFDMNNCFLINGFYYTNLIKLYNFQSIIKVSRNAIV